MAMASLSPSSVLASPIQVNPQVKSDLQASVPQVAQDALKSAKTAQTDTVTISTQALKMADDKNAVAKQTTDKADKQRAASDFTKNTAQKNALNAYAAVSTNQ